jgi:hypothetical protein
MGIESESLLDVKIAHLAEFKNTYFRKLYIQQIESIFSKDCRIE